MISGSQYACGRTQPGLAIETLHILADLVADLVAWRVQGSLEMTKGVSSVVAALPEDDYECIL